MSAGCGGQTMPAVTTVIGNLMANAFKEMG
jgi:hypothetical protein